ncbi:MAG: sulfotransferase family 2 domain-containing protein [Desulfococcaceae bacterium]|jgi:hypothetical protein|nr:sulfotransferase family 2 domain-containing protein [Desulfococcaceae bacterium]
MTVKDAKMLISYTHKFIFFHVAKAAGLSIREALRPYVQEPERFKIRRPPKMTDGKPNPIYEMWENTLLHAKAGDVRKELEKDIYDSFYKFAFVRNPWDWQVSMYHFILKDPIHVKHKLVTSMGGFEEFLEWVIASEKPYPRGASKFQKDVITDEQGNLIIDFAGRFENLAHDFAHVCRVIGIRASLPRINTTDHRDYRDYYNNNTKKMVAEHFREDIELFGYTFDG